MSASGLYVQYRCQTWIKVEHSHFPLSGDDCEDSSPVSQHVIKVWEALKVNAAQLYITAQAPGCDTVQVIQ